MKDRLLTYRLILTCIILMMILGTVMGQSTKDNIESLLTKHDVQYPKIVLAQAILESGWFKCTDCSWKYNNPFGFFWKGEYKKFKDLNHAVVYYKTWQDKWYKKGDYYSFLVKIGYAEDPQYIHKLKQIVKRL